MVDDETNLIWTGGVVIQSLLLTVMIEKKKDIAKGDTLFASSHEIDSKLLLLFGDGLSCERFRNMKGNLLKKHYCSRMITSIQVLL